MTVPAVLPFLLMFLLIWIEHSYDQKALKFAQVFHEYIFFNAAQYISSVFEWRRLPAGRSFNCGGWSLRTWMRNSPRLATDRRLFL